MHFRGDIQLSLVCVLLFLLLLGAFLFVCFLLFTEQLKYTEFSCTPQRFDEK